MRARKPRFAVGHVENGWKVLRVCATGYVTRCPKCDGAERIRTRRQMETTGSCMPCASHHAKKTLCPKGHEYKRLDDPNQRTHRVCVICNRENNRRNAREHYKPAMRLAPYDRTPTEARS